MKKWVARGLFLLLSGLSLAAPNWELYLSPDLSLALCKPQGWEVKLQDGPQARTLVVSPPQQADAAAVMTLASTGDKSNDSLAFAIRTVARMRETTPSLQLSWARSTQDRRRTVMESHYRSAEGVEMRFRGYFLMDYPQARMLGYELPASEFARLQPTMLSILSNLTVLNQNLLQPAAAQRLSRLTARPQPLAMAPQNLSDGSAGMQVPQGWTLQGAQGTAVCLSPDQECGFCFATSSFWAPSRMPYFDNSALPGLHHAYSSPIEAVALLMQQVGSSSIQVEQMWDHPDRAQEARQSLNRGAQCQSALLLYQTRQGVATRGFFDALNLAPLPSGQWLVIYWGVWAPAPSWDNWLPTLIPAAASYRIQEQWAADYIRRGLQRLREQMERTQAAMADTARYARETNLAIFQEKMRSGDYIDYKRTATIRGEQEWVSEVEGGALYKSDSWGLSREGQYLLQGQQGNYNNFQGENPRYRETMTPVDSSREVYERVFRGR